MDYFPKSSSLRTSFDRGEIVPVSFKIPYPKSSVTLLHKFQSQTPFIFLDSASSLQTGQYSFLALDPWLTFKSYGLYSEIQRGEKIEKKVGSPLEVLRQLFSKFKTHTWSNFGPFTSGAVGFLSYDLVRTFEKLPTKTDEFACPDLYFMFPRTILTLDIHQKVLQVTTLLLGHEKISFKTAFHEACERLEKINSLLQKETIFFEQKSFEIGPIIPQSNKRQFEQMVKKARSYIQAGDIYQANLSQRFDFKLTGSLVPFYEKLRQVNPSPYSSFLNLDFLQVASASPELLIKRTGRKCQTRPIAGTRPRGKSSEEDQILKKELFLSEKERAEHLMLVDLERNDLGRVCDFDSVEVKELMTLESYSHVNHIVSHITGRLRKKCDSFDLLRAMFPGGTITGCPKIRSMQIIDELEPVRRNLYTGSIGFLDFSGDLDFNIVIRSLVAFSNQASIQVGAGIVWDSDPEKEYQETLHKAQALFQALEVSSQANLSKVLVS